jgi:hypothetical protein
VSLHTVSAANAGLRGRPLLSRVGRAVVTCLLGALAPGSFAHGQDPDLRGWSITYADGRVVTHVLRAKGGLWTPMFPRLRTTRIAPSGSAKYLDIRYVREGDDLVATVSLATDKFRDRVSVAVVRVPFGASVRVEQLDQYGVAPITLSVVTIGPVQAYAPVAVEPSGQWVVSGEPVQPNAPIYRFTVINQSGRPLRAFDYAAYQGDMLLLSGRQKTPRNEPLLMPGKEYAFELTLSNTAGEPWKTIDRIVFTSVVWDDGTVNGDLQPVAHERVLARTRALHLRHLLEVLASSDATRVDELRRAFEALDRSDYALENARAEALRDLGNLRHAPAEELETWVGAKRREYTAWQRRCERAAQK